MLLSSVIFRQLVVQDGDFEGVRRYGITRQEKTLKAQFWDDKRFREYDYNSLRDPHYHFRRHLGNRIRPIINSHKTPFDICGNWPQAGRRRHPRPTPPRSTTKVWRTAFVSKGRCVQTTVQLRRRSVNKPGRRNAGKGVSRWRSTAPRVHGAGRGDTTLTGLAGFLGGRGAGWLLR